jgi:hypothetical protein
LSGRGHRHHHPLLLLLASYLIGKIMAKELRIVAKESGEVIRNLDFGQIILGSDIKRIDFDVANMSTSMIRLKTSLRVKNENDFPGELLINISEECIQPKEVSYVLC